MSMSRDSSTFHSLSGDDLALLGGLERTNQWLRAVLCTLARRGVGVRRADPPRARSLIEALSVHPLYKAGQVIFDLTELEDFMVSGPPPEPLPTALDATSLQRWRRVLVSAARLLDGAALDPGEPAATISASAEGPQELPPLEPGFYLFQDVVLGLVVSAGPLAGAAAAMNPPGPDTAGHDPRGEVPERERQAHAEGDGDEPDVQRHVRAPGPL